MVFSTTLRASASCCVSAAFRSRRIWFWASALSPENSDSSRTASESFRMRDPLKLLFAWRDAYPSLARLADKLAQQRGDAYIASELFLLAAIEGSVEKKLATWGPQLKNALKALPTFSI